MSSGSGNISGDRDSSSSSSNNSSDESSCSTRSRKIGNRSSDTDSSFSTNISSSSSLNECYKVADLELNSNDENDKKGQLLWGKKSKYNDLNKKFNV